MSFSRQVAGRFDAAAKTYDAHSAVQRHAAAQLAGIIATTSLPPRPRILEIGCGTGHLTARLVQHLPGAHILATDIAPSMVDVCRQRLAGRSSIDFAVMDGCRPAGADFYDLICANLAAQWFADLPDALARLTRRLAPGGLLALSLLGKNTFCEWRTAHARHGLRPGTLAFPAAAEIPGVLPAVGNTRIRTEHWIDHPASGLAFLQGLRALGADMPHGTHTPLSAAQLRRILRELGAQPAITYELIYACWRQGTP